MIFLCVSEKEKQSLKESHARKTPMTNTDHCSIPQPTLLDPVRAIADPMEEAHRLMLLVSAGNNIVWPLYHVGMSSVCPPAMKAYCIERLDAVYKESGLRQASAIATIIANREVIPQWLELSFADGY